MDVVTLLSGTAGASLVGAIGGIVNGVINYKTRMAELQAQAAERQSARQHELALNQHELAILDKKTDAEYQLTELKGQLEGMRLENQNLSMTYTHDMEYIKSGSLLQWVRPTLTVVFDLCLMFMAAYLLYQLQGHIHTLAATKGMELLEQIIRDISYIAVTCTLWWFGGRAGYRAAK